MYQPQYVNNTKDFIRRHGGVLLSFLGKTLSEAWVVWDNEDNEWFPDGPVVLDFEGDVLEFCCNELDLISITMNTMSLDTPPKLGWSDGFDLSWKSRTHKELVNVIGKKLKTIEVVEYQLTTNELSTNKINSCWLLNGVQLGFGEGKVNLFNALDQNGISSTFEDDESIKLISL